MLSFVLKISKDNDFLRNFFRACHMVATLNFLLNEGFIYFNMFHCIFSDLSHMRYSAMQARCMSKNSRKENSVIKQTLVCARVCVCVCMYGARARARVCMMGYGYCYDSFNMTCA